MRGEQGKSEAEADKRGRAEIGTLKKEKDGLESGKGKREVEDKLSTGI